MLHLIQPFDYKMGRKICLCMLGEDDAEESEAEEAPSAKEDGRYGNRKTIVTTQTTTSSHCNEEIAKSDTLVLNVDQDKQGRCYEEDTMYTIPLASPVETTKERDWYTPVLKLLNYLFT